ncbi:MAG: tRNA adenosine deaminase-associated protein [Mycobacteriales bacterium]|nr:tRNA adenosine deaminase-associated protein [Actinomycetota bacterium]
MADDYAVVVVREEGRWDAARLPDRYTESLDDLVAALRQQAGDPVIGLINVADEFFVAVRASGSEVRMLLSDITAAVAWDLAADVADRLGVAVPGEDDVDQVWPAGDLSIFTDLGIDEMELGAVLADLDAYADEMLLSIARRAGYADAFERVTEGSPG